MAAAVWIFWGAPAMAQVPTQIPFQGLLLDSGGTPVNGSVDLDFELFDSLAAGTSLWTESHLGVIVVDGVYSVDLGASTPITNATLTGGAAFLEIVVDGETLTPRQQFMSVPYALVADEADSLGGLPSVYFREMLEHFEFDGPGPSNLHPDEGFGDTDGDGIANFMDPDNDNDGVSDEVEAATGRDINLLSPSINSRSPSQIRAYQNSTLVMTGTGLDTLASVTFGAETPTATNITPTSFEIAVQAETAAPEFSVVATLANGQSHTSAPVTIRPVNPTIWSVSPNPIPSYAMSTLLITGNDLEFVTSVDFGSDSPTPTNITQSGFQISVVTESSTSSEAVIATLNYAGIVDTASSPLITIQHVAPTISSSPGFLEANTPHDVVILGSGYYAGTVVQFAGQTLIPTSISTSSLDVTLPAVAPGSYTIQIDHPNGLSVSAPFVASTTGTIRTVFVSSSVIGGNIGGLAGADAMCQAEAVANGLSGTYLAWLSDGTDSPSTRFNQSAGPYVLPNGATVALDWADLTDGTLVDRIHVLANSTTSVSGSFIYTGTLFDGTSAGASADATNCDGWTNTGTTALRGTAGSAGSFWTDQTQLACSIAARVYCFQN